MTVDAPLPSPLSGADAGRFDLAFAALGELGTVSAELSTDFGAVVFAITLFLCGLIFD
ncbi:MAG: hypothetical protein JO104_12110 [Candidatus Eremiobacteraeota bacterium]|nr:hypothetical protein [Candidatus Eremiobacteraeota bacterium]